MYGEVDPYESSEGEYQPDPNEGQYQPDPNAGVYQPDPLESVAVIETATMDQPTAVIDESQIPPETVSNGTDFPPQNGYPTGSHPMYSTVAPPAKTGISAVASDLTALANAASSGDATTIMNAMEQFSKSQLVRFLDISIIGPLLVMWAYRGKLSKGERFLMGLIGAGTVVYNGRNYLANKKIMQPDQITAIKNQLSQTVNQYAPEIPYVDEAPAVTPEIIDTGTVGYY